MGIIIEPKIKVDDIKLTIDKNAQYSANNIINTWGPTMPVIKINDYILGAGEVRSFNLSVKINSIPKFNITVNDSNFKIRNALKKEKIDTSVIFIGFKDWYIKFNGIILNTPSEAGDESLYISGSFFNEKLYNSIQKAYNKLSVLDTLTDICKLTDMGLFVYSNNSLTNIIDNNINPNKKHIDFFIDNIKKYTNNIWAVDTHGYFHVSDIETLRKQPFDKFKIYNGKVGTIEKDIVITTDNSYSNVDSDNINEKDESKINNKFKVDYYTINSNIGNVHINNNNKYNISGVGTNPNKKELKTIDNIGISSESDNTFDRFLNSYFPYYNNIINKDIGGKVINLEMTDLIYEISPFTIVNLEIYLPIELDTSNKLDTENSGKKIVIGYEFDYTNTTQEEKFPKIRQSIDLI